MLFSRRLFHWVLFCEIAAMLGTSLSLHAQEVSSASTGGDTTLSDETLTSQPPSIPSAFQEYIFETEAVDLSGSVEYRRKNSTLVDTKSIGANQIVIRFEPFRGLLPSTITIDLDKQNIAQADIELLKFWVQQVFTARSTIEIGALGYRRNLEGSVIHDLKALSARVPLYADVGQSCDEPPCAFAGAMAITIGADVGYRWLNDVRHDAYAEPNVAISATAAILNRIFVGIAEKSSYSALFFGADKNYFTHEGTLKLGVGLDADSSVRLGLKVGWSRYGANANFNRPLESRFVGAYVEWDGSGLP